MFLLFYGLSFQYKVRFTKICRLIIIVFTVLVLVSTVYTSWVNMKTEIWISNFIAVRLSVSFIQHICTMLEFWLHRNQCMQEYHLKLQNQSSLTIISWIMGRIQICEFLCIFTTAFVLFLASVEGS